MLSTKPKRAYSLRLAQPSYWNKPDPSADPLWASKASHNPRSQGAPFWLLDGPPYANGDLHLGHVLNKCLKDAFARHQAARGRLVAWRAGWDCHGLPLELATQKRAGSPDRRQPEFLSACRQEATHWKERQASTFYRLGSSADLAHPWTTMDPERESKAMGLLLELWEAGVLVERHSPTHWCPACQSALAASELEKKDAPKESLHAWTPLATTSSEHLLSHLGMPSEPVCLTYWTTTPWTLWANQAFALSKQGLLALSRLPNGWLTLVSANRLGDLALAHNCSTLSPLATLSNADFALMRPQARSPLADRLVPVELASFALDSEGTGFVHVAPAFGPEDFEWAESRPDLGLDMSTPMGKGGRYQEGSGRAAGLDRKAAGALALAQLAENSAVLAYAVCQGETQACWRHGEPVFYMASRQWALDLDKGFKTCPEGLRARALAALDHVQFLPTPKARNALERMLAGRRHWTLSRDRHWGLPLPFLRDSNGSVSPATNVWWRQAMAEVSLGGVEAYARMEAPAGLAKEGQCVDVWFDSGCAFETAKEPGLGSPDLVVEGADQTRGWFLSSMLLGAFRSEKPVFKAVACHGFVVDEKGRKLSKSMGNAPDTEALLQEHGADTLRLWSLSQTMGEDVVWSKKSLAQAASEVKEWRNFLRFLLAHQGGSEAILLARPHSPLEHLAVKRCLLARHLWLDAFDKGMPHVALASLADFRRWASSTWFELSKRALYCQADNVDLARRKALFSWVLSQVSPLLAPFLPLALSQAHDALDWTLESTNALWLLGHDLAWDESLSRQAQSSLDWRDGLFKLLDERRSLDGAPKQRYALDLTRAEQAAIDFGAETAHLVRGLCFAGGHRDWGPLNAWQAVTGWECPRCRGLFHSHDEGASHDHGSRAWLQREFGLDLCSACHDDERAAHGQP